MVTGARGIIIAPDVPVGFRGNWMMNDEFALGLGYVGLPLSVEFGKNYPTIGADIGSIKVAVIENTQHYLNIALPDTEAVVSELIARVGYRPRPSVETGVAAFVDCYRGYYGDQP